MIELASVAKSFGESAVLRGVSFVVNPGEIYGLVGPNGSGKTTAIKTICGLLEPDAGVVRIDGSRDPGAARASFGVAPQELAVYEQLTCRENLELFADLCGVARSQRGTRVATVINQFRLAHYADTAVAELSGGWRRRVNIAVATIHSPAALILDEPTAGLDVEARHELWELIEQLRAHDCAILLTTHQLEEAERLCSRVGVLSGGEVVAEGTMDELREGFPAACLAEVEAESRAAVIDAAATHGWKLRDWGGPLTICLPRRYAFNEVIEALDGCRLTSARLLEVRLEHVYLECTNRTSADPVVDRSILAGRAALPSEASSTE